MNGSRSKNDSNPIHLCPVDLHKLCAFHNKTLRNTSFDIEDRYRRLYDFYSRNRGFESSALWVQRMLDTCFGGATLIPKPLTPTTPTPTPSPVAQVPNIIYYYFLFSYVHYLLYFLFLMLFLMNYYWFKCLILL